jgi:GNAT superfamily N-acetyltransferase
MDNHPFFQICHSFVVDERWLVACDVNPFHFGEEGEIAAWIARTCVPKPLRGKGHGSRARRQLCAAADEHGVTLYSVPYAYGGDTGLSQAELIKWYSRYGFEHVEKGLWRRKPARPN